MPPEFSVVSPMYNVEPYLPDYLHSLEEQTYPFADVEVILVDDGSMDGTLRIAREFAERHPHVQVITKPNGGQSSARNAGLAVATGTWISFPDPDDVLEPDYLSIIAGAARQSERWRTAVISARLLLWYEATGKVAETHALDRRFRGGERIVDLDREPNWIQPHVTSGFVRRDLISRAALAFPEELRVRFEDGNFISRYLLHAPRPVVHFVPDARYRYRQRADNSSTIQRSASDPRKYTDTIRVGFQGVIDEAGELGKRLPRWAQNLFLYDQFWILKSSQTAAVRNAVFPPQMHDELATLVPGYLQHVDDDLILGFSLLPVAQWMREALWLAKRRRGHGPVYAGARDPSRGLASLVYRYIGEQPRERIRADGREIESRFTKTQQLEYVGRPLIHQRTLWVPDDAAIVLELDGRDVGAVRDRPPAIVPPFGAAAKPNRVARAVRRVSRAIRRRLSRRGLFLLRRDLAVHDPRLAARFRNAWVFIDRDVDANDSAEDMYWWLREHHPDVNAWFSVRKDSPDWARMRARGARLVPYGSPRFVALLTHAEHLASTHADRFITDALPRKLRGRYSFTFLQHGVIKGDISGWLNPKRIDTFVVSTVAEYDYVSGPSPFRFGPKEVRLTGLPRFDALLETAAKAGEGSRKLVLVMPTWRNYLVGQMGRTSRDREAVDDFLATDYAQTFGAFLRSSSVMAAARGKGLEIAFMPHPNMGPYLEHFRVPGVNVLSYADVDVRDVLSRAAVLVTDYSSIAFNAAYIDIPLVYLQFDQDSYYAGHTERRAYFDYERDGFGPVCTTAREAESVVTAIIEHGPDAVYASRTRAAFPVRDGRNRERVLRAMMEARTRRSRDARERAAVPESW